MSADSSADPSSAPCAGLPPELVQRLARVRLVALDVDGVLTDGRVIYVGDQEQQAFDVQDGQGLAWLAEFGIRMVWITGRGSRPTERRADELGVARLYVRAGEKSAVLARAQEALQVAPDETVAMGDDIPDLGLASASGVFVAPASARPELRARADHVTRAGGGRGAVRELCELLLDARGAWGPEGPRRA